jgi:hypothetical protein
VTDWNRIILDIKAGKFDTEKEYEEIKLRASKKSVFSQAFTPRKKVKFTMEGAIAGMQAVDLEASSEIRTLLKPRRTVSEGAVHSLTEQEWEAVCTYVQLLSTRLPELQEILFDSKTALSERLMGVEDELGAAALELPWKIIKPWQNLLAKFISKSKRTPVTLERRWPRRIRPIRRPLL